jgi:Skp family chaperone for outer membrane proteins
MKQLFALAGGAILVVIGAVHVRSVGPSMVTVSLQRVAAQSNAGKRANQQLETLRLERGRELVAKQKELEDVVRQLAKTDTLPAADRDRLSQDENRRRADLQQLTLQAQTDFQNAQLRLQAEVRGQLSPILADIAQRYGVDVVLNSDMAVAWAAPGTDTTNEVLQRLNAAPQ